MGMDAEALGRRIGEARGRAGVTQAELATEVGIDRSAIAKIESGQRRVSAVELGRTAAALQMRIEWFLDDAPHALVSRRNAQDPGSPSPRIDAMAERITREVEFVLRHDDRITPAAVQARTMPETAAGAEELAATARNLLRVPLDGPCTGLAEKVAAVGLFPFSLDLGAESADAATVLLDTGGVAIVNGGLRVGRRRLALAHELGHFLVADDYAVDWRIAETLGAEHREALFDRFARALLLPAQSLRAVWEQHTSADGDTRTAAVRIASSYRVDMATLARRLIELGLAARPDADRIRATRTNRADIVELDLVVGDELAPPALPREYERAVLRLFRSESITAARAMDLLLDTWTEDMLPTLPQRGEDQIWQYI
ncbi:hypothetical protein GCM10027271_41890 [Saccharopolyspora gloriosae]|uniref:Zn-dependent peptidase ImmA (M78 family)/transcriptional regulator with XRE-family HTH domain n=1 Tax=Saccharopolyspora gloriosae TaxID=455344 RepID=A0A840NNC4_9PSEU|nr:XRE family transcriptional regulator [Saccharopolyspora gloriosae]MBB5070779.1 Zn-dependent peptidase ImmA (M78 family)/transcriptional regulator with XRE-family HTH domain [Saccharopolyspora gloriosae]